MKYDMNEANNYLVKWIDILRLNDWDIKIHEVTKEWRKSGEMKIDQANRQAVMMLNNFNPYVENLEALVVHELLHLKLWGMDQMIEMLINSTFGTDQSDPKYQFAFSQFMEVLEPTVEDLTKSFISLHGKNKDLSFGRLMKQVYKEIDK